MTRLDVTLCSWTVTRLSTLSGDQDVGINSRFLKRKEKFLTVLKNTYKGIKSQIVANGQLNEQFTCSVGVRQGENLPAPLFYLDVNDLEQCLIGKGCKPLGLCPSNVEFDHYTNYTSRLEGCYIVRKARGISAHNKMAFKNNAVSGNSR